jgi:hypothetical protein
MLASIDIAIFLLASNLDMIICLYHIMHLQNLQVFTFSHPVVETLREVIIDVVYLALIREFASTPQVWMILI